MKFHVWSPAFENFGGGIAAFARELSFALSDLGHDLRLHGKLDTTGKLKHLDLRGTGHLPPPIRTAGFAAATFGSCLRDQPDHIISTHVNFLAVAHAAARLAGTPFSAVAHGIDVHDDLSMLRRAALRAAHRIYAVSSWTRDRVLALSGVDTKRVFLLPNTFDELRFKPGSIPGQLAERYGIQPGELVVLTVARLDAGEAYKGYDRVIRAMPAIAAACGAVRFILVGDGPDRARVELLAREVGVGDRVTFCGFVSDEELAGHYRLADVFAMPSTGEGFGIVYLESMACGTPVLAGNVDGSVDALDHGRLGRLVDPTDIDQIAAGIVSLLRRQGPSAWFEPESLHRMVKDQFGRDAFRERVRAAVSLPA